MPHLLAERFSCVQNALDLISPARNAGWLSVWPCAPGELLCGSVWLGLGSQAIPVRLVLQAPGVDELLAQLARAVFTDFHLEQFVLLVGFSREQCEAFRRQVSAPPRRIHVGDYGEYLAWVTTRLGPLGVVPGTSPVRRLLDTLLTFSTAPSPSKLVPLHGNFGASKIAESFRIGAEGVQAITTLLSHAHGPAAVQNVEDDKAWQKQDVDLLVSGAAGAMRFKDMRVEIKNEAYRSGNISLELFSSFDHKTPGWLRYSTADVLISGAWPTGDFLVMDFQKVRDWILAGDHRVPLRYGTAKGQSYRSQFYCTPMQTLLATFDDVFCLKLDAWLPAAYAGRFASDTLIPQKYRYRQLMPMC